MSPSLRATPHVAAVAVAALVLVLTFLPSAPAAAAGPLPPLTGCLARGAFTLQDEACSDLVPLRGDRFGPIDSVRPVSVPASGSVQLSFPGGETIDFDKPTGACGENGCPTASVLWRATGSQGVGMSGGCGSRDVDCSVSVTPGVGDAGEDYRVVLAQRYNGITPVGGVAFALYAPPQLYPVRVDTITPAGTAFPVDENDMAYAVRDGTSASQADCVANDWWIEASRQARVDAPACITLAGSSSQGYGFTGVLPNTGSWTITGSPSGELQAPIGSRPTPFDRVRVTPAGDDIWVSMDHHDRPAIEVELAPATTTMDLGTTQDVTLTLRAAGGDGGSIPTIGFAVPEVLETIADPDAALTVGTPAGGMPADLSLDPSETRTLTIPVTAVGLGTTILRVTVNSIDDIGGVSIDGVSVPITVAVGDAATGDGPSPVISHARDLAATFSDLIDGTIAGPPGSQATVSLASAQRAADGSCARTMSGGDVEQLGSVAVDIGPDGTGAFSLTRRLGPQRFVYGIAVADGVVSPVGECTAVTSTDPAIGLTGSEVTEPAGTRAKPTSADAHVALVLSDPSESPVTVTVASADGTATAPDDYTALAPTVITFAPGETTHELPIEVVGDGRKDDEETFGLLLSDPVDGHIDPAATSTVTILDPDQEDVGGTTGIAGWYSGKSTVKGKDYPSVKHFIKATQYDAESGRLVFTMKSTDRRFADGKVKGTLKNGRFRGSIDQKGWVPVDYDCTLSTPDGVSTFTCEVDQPKYHNLKHEHYQQVWTHE
ncbi:MAG: Calx-beta domain-containing protein [Chloroflexota bacterium]